MIRYPYVLSMCRRAASTKTRIETSIEEVLHFLIVWVAGRHPLKQGLKPKEYRNTISSEKVAGRHPLKQGLKHQSVILSHSTSVRGRRAASTKTRIETLQVALVKTTKIESQGGIH